MDKEYLIIGQGIAGSLLAHELIKKGSSVDIYNETNNHSASMIAGGIYNPVTGRNMVKTWEADKLFPELETYYTQLENILSTKFLYKTGIYRPFFTAGELNDWQGKVGDKAYTNYVDDLKTKPMPNSPIHDEYGGLMLKNAGYVNTKKLVNSFKSYFEKFKIYHETNVSLNDININEGFVSFSGKLYKRVIFCEGMEARNNKYFNWLPFKLVKGEILDVEIPYQESFILNRGVFLLPSLDGQHLRLGATYDNHNLNNEPTQAAIDYLKEKLSVIYNSEFKVKKHSAGVRPATKDRKPFIGTHPTYSELCIFNGFGTKGVSLAVYYAKQFSDFLINSKPIDQEVNIERFSSFYVK